MAAITNYHSMSRITRTESEREPQYCAACRTPFHGDFKEIVYLRNSGLVIYKHNYSPKCNKSNINSVVLHNIGDKHLKRFDFVTELCQYKTKCYHCQVSVKCIQRLLDEIDLIRKNEILAVCQYCKRLNLKGNCKRCELLINKFINNKVQQNDNYYEKYKSWLCKVRDILTFMLKEKGTCKDVYHSFESDEELENLIRLIKSSPDDSATTPYLKDITDSADNIENKKSLQQILSEFTVPEKTLSVVRYIAEKTEPRSKICLEIPNDDITKKKTDNSLYQISQNKGKNKSPNLLNIKVKQKKVKDKEETIEFNKKHSKNKAQETKNNVAENQNISPKLTQKKVKSDMKMKLPSKIPIKKPSQINNDISDFRILLDLLNKKKMAKLGKEDKKTEIYLKLPKFENVSLNCPSIASAVVSTVASTKEIYDNVSTGTTLLCTPRCAESKNIVMGNKIVRHGCFKSYSTHSLKPLIFESQYRCPSMETLPKIVSETKLSDTIKIRPTAATLKVDTKGMTKYALSNQRYIENGWTILPTSKVMRKLYLYKMKPADPTSNWFHVHRNDVLQYYDTGELLARIYGSDNGVLYYKNGSIALNFHHSTELNVQQRYIIYEEKEIDSLDDKPSTILACFDYMGNGIVFDYSGKVRLKYNQTEGIVIDRKIGPRSRWKWHCLNDPLVLDRVFNEQYYINSKRNEHDHTSIRSKSINNEMVAIELDYLAKERSSKIKPKFKPFEIRTKVFKLNDYFSLRIINQSNIYILFRCGRTRLKLNVGMRLKSDEIVDTQTTELSKVFTPYDQNPTLSDSVQNIHNVMREASMKSSRRLPFKL